MSLATPSNCSAIKDAHLVAQAALLLAERAYAEGNAQEAEHLVNVAHRLFGAMFDVPCLARPMPN